MTHLLERKCIETYLPLIPRVRRWSDRSKTVLWPAFPDYVFARTMSADLWHLRATAGVRYVVCHGARPAVVRDADIENVRRVIATIEATGTLPDEEERLEDAPCWVDGEAVQVVDGPFAGVEGFIRERRGCTRLVITISSIGRSISLNIDARLVKRIAERTDRPTAMTPVRLSAE